MQEQTLRNLIDNIVLHELKGYVYLELKDIIEVFEKFCNNEDLGEILEYIGNSTKYNYITCQDGKSYIFGTKKSDIKDFVKWASEKMGELDISENDPVWREFIYCEDSWKDKLYFFLGEDN